MSHKLVLSKIPATVLLIALFTSAADKVDARIHNKSTVNKKTAEKPISNPCASSHKLTVSSVVESWANRADLKHSLIGINVLNLHDGTELADVNGHRRFTPASTAKIIVTACAFEKLGPNFKYTTKLITNGQLNNATVNGDLILVPSQDPTITKDQLRKLFAVLVEKGVRKVKGKLLINEPVGGGERFLGEWLGEDYAQDWMPVSSSLVIERNHMSPNDLIHSKVFLSNAFNANGALEKTLLSYQLTPGWLYFNPKQREVDLYVAPAIFALNEHGKNDPKTTPRPVINPDAFNLAYLKELAQTCKIKIEEQSGFKSNDNPLVLSEQSSAPLDEIIKTTLHESDNLYAQQLLRTIGSSSLPKGARTEFLENLGLQTIKEWLNQIGASGDEFVLWDACGLSRKDSVSPHTLNSVVRHMANNPKLADYLSLLKQADIEPSGKFAFKTGAMDGIRGVTGLLKTASGQELAITVLINGHSTSVADLRTFIGVLINDLARL